MAPSEVSRLIARIPAARARWGWHGVARRSIDKASVYAALPVRRAYHGRSSFRLGDTDLPFLVHPYNATWRGERMVEVPVAMDFLQRNDGPVLEVGNVLGYYGFEADVVVDKYETADGVINEDIVDYEPSTKFGAIVAISTFEHIGWDETPRHPSKILDAVRHAVMLLAPGGQLLLTCPRGFNSWLDVAIASDTLAPAKEYFLHREHGKWTSQTRDQALSITPRYVDNGLTRSAHDVWVAVWNSQTS